MKQQFLRYIAVICLCLFSVISSMGQGVSIKYSGENFATSERRIVVKSPVAQYQTDLSEWLLTLEGVVMTDIFSKMFTPSVTLKYTKAIEGNPNSYKLTVKKNKVLIKYTNPEMLEDAVAQLYKLEGESNGKRFIRGATVFYARNASGEINIRTNGAGVYDGISKKQSQEDIEQAIRAQANSDDKKFILAIANKSLFRADFDVFKDVNPSMPSICTSESYSQDEIIAQREYANTRGVTFVPALDLLSNNTAFENFTGHSAHSVEGMRFVRAMIEQCANEWGVTALCLGTMSKSEAPSYFIEFIQDIADRNSIELIIL